MAGDVEGKQTRDNRKSKAQLVAELTTLRRTVEQLAQSVARGAGPSLREGESQGAVYERIDFPQQPFLATFDQAAVGILHLRRDGTAIRVNQAACRLMDGTSEELLQGRILGRIDMRDREIFAAAVDEVWREEVSDCSIESRLLRRDGLSVWGHVSISAARTAPGGARFLLVIISEITKQKHAEEALRTSRERLRAVVGNAPIVLWAMDRDGVLTFVEGAGLRALRLEPPQIVGRSVFDLYADSPSVIATSRKALEGKPGVSTVQIESVFFEVSFAPQHDEHGELAGVIGVSTDVTKRANAEAALQRARSELEQRVVARTEELSRANSELKREVTERKRAVEAVLQQTRILQSVLDSVGDGIVVCDEEGRFLLFNPAAQQIVGIGPSDVGRTEWSSHYGLYLPDQTTPYPPSQLPLSRALDGKEVDDVEIYVQREELAEGTWISVNARPLRDEFGKACGAVAAVRDVTQEKMAREKLRAEQRLLENSLAVHERDRQLMAYELHDGLVQDVSGALMHLEALRGKLPDCGPDADQRFDLVCHLLRQAIAEARQVISGLRPPILDELGVVAAIAHLVDEQSDSDGPEILFIHDIQEERLAPLLEGTLFRIVQEALANVKKHSQATKVRVELTQPANEIRLAISDNGVGFDPSDVPESRYGLPGIRKRAELLRGRATIDSTPGQGTRVVVVLPVSLAQR